MFALKQGGHWSENKMTDEVGELRKGLVLQGLRGHCKNFSCYSE